MGVDAHEHAWKMTIHLDQCHAYMSAYACACGATASTYNERDFKDDPYSAIWMLEDDGEEKCERCAELLAGAEPKHDRQITEAAGA